MAYTQFSVSWDAYTKNICNGLTSLQQRGEFVDMTLAADGHLVRVHRMVLSLVSPYIKELIASTDCPHPVIFLNQISYRTLCDILEYVYTGEVLIEKDNINEFVAAGQALHIRGLEDLSFSIQRNDSSCTTIKTENTNATNCVNTEETDDEITDYSTVSHEMNLTDVFDKSNNQERMKDSKKKSEQSTADTDISCNKALVQYSVTSRGSLQLLLNRYLYNLRYAARNSDTQRWLCVDGHWKGLKCTASVVIKNNVVTRRIATHNHPFHDKKILKKVQAGMVFTKLHDAKLQGVLIQKERQTNTDEDNIQ